MTKLYAVIGGCGYEGLDFPEVIFDSREKAEAYVKSGVMGCKYDDATVEEYVINEPKKGLVIHDQARNPLTVLCPLLDALSGRTVDAKRYS